MLLTRFASIIAALVFCLALAGGSGSDSGFVRPAACLGAKNVVRAALE